jgi:LmbE family N-acetylglucosaminyl deacetylase
MPTPLLIVAPDNDDAVLSCFALLDRDDAVDIIDVFVGEPDPPVQGWWDRRCGFATSAEAAATRRGEERAAYTGTPHRVSFLELLSVQYVDGTRPASERETIRETVANWGERNTGGSIALPAGAGWSVSALRSWLGEHVHRRIGERPGPPRHPDHVFARDAALAAAVALPNIDVFLYEELPYLWGRPADWEVRRLESSWGIRAEPFELPVDRERKAARIACHASQIEHISPPHGRVDDPRVLPPVERYWRLVRPEAA